MGQNPRDNLSGITGSLISTQFFAHDIKTVVPRKSKQSVYLGGRQKFQTRTPQRSIQDGNLGGSISLLGVCPSHEWTTECKAREPHIREATEQFERKVSCFGCLLLPMRKKPCLMAVGLVVDVGKQEHEEDVDGDVCKDDPVTMVLLLLLWAHWHCVCLWLGGCSRKRCLKWCWQHCDGCCRDGISAHPRHLGTRWRT